MEDDKKCEVGHFKNSISNDSWIINSLLHDMIFINECNNNNTIIKFFILNYRTHSKHNHTRPMIQTFISKLTIISSMNLQQLMMMMSLSQHVQKGV